MGSTEYKMVNVHGNPRVILGGEWKQNLEGNFNKFLDVVLDLKLVER